MKKYLKVFFVVAVATVAGYNVYQSQSVMADMSELALANVEALAGPGEEIVNNCAGCSTDYNGDKCCDIISGTTVISLYYPD